MDNGTGLLSADAILLADDLKYEVVDVPEWGGRVRVREMTASERDGFEASMLVIRGKKTEMRWDRVRARLCALCIVDERNVRLFADEQIDALGAKSARALQRCYDVASRLSGMNQEEVERLAGESAGVPSADSSFD